MGLRPTKADKNTNGADLLVRAGPRGPAVRDDVECISKPTRASAADQGVRPTCVFKGALPRNFISPKTSQTTTPPSQIQSESQSA
jgi:hypothetical protein